MVYKAAIIGTGSRGLFMFANPIIKEFSDTTKIVAYFDSNILRAKAANQISNTQFPEYSDFDKLMKEQDPDIIVVTSKDSTHCEYILKGLDKNKIVFSEKPVCTTIDQVNAIRQAVKKSKGQLFVTHNMRYGNSMIKIKEMLDTGVIGKLLTIDFRETLDRNHGADYFRRWHGRKENSGGLLIHKSSHHFDILNWFASSNPAYLNARGSVAFYGKNGPFRSKRCLGCAHAKDCQFYFDISKNETAKTLYQLPEIEDGYYRDGCLYDEGITTEDNAGVVYQYQNGILANYSLNAFASYEGMLISLEGTKGRIEYESVHGTQWAMGSNVIHGEEKVKGNRLTHIHPTQGVKEIVVPVAEGSHGGADPALRNDFFRKFLKDKKPESKMAGAEEALQAVLIGVAANISIAEKGRTIDVQSLLK